jgi:hypothetical protein
MWICPVSSVWPWEIGSTAPWIRQRCQICKNFVVRVCSWVTCRKALCLDCFPDSALVQ